MAWFRKPSRSKPSQPSKPKVERLETRDQPAATLLADLNPTPASPFVWPDAGAELGGSVYFAATDGTHPAAVWKSDGTPAGTKLVAELPGMQQPFQFVTAGDKVYFTHAEGNAGHELWVTDGTAAGTKMVTDLNPGNPASFPTNLTAVGGKLVFTARTTTAYAGSGTLFATDGTAAGTVAIRDLSSENGGQFAATGGKAYFSGRVSDPVTHQAVSRLWVTDGTAAGTEVTAALPTGTEVMTYTGPNWIAAAGSKIYFSATDPTRGSELWVSDGTKAGTKLVADLDDTLSTNPYAGDAGSNPQQFAVLGKTVYFAADDGEHGPEVWRTDGTAAGTKMVTDLSPDGEPVPITTNPYSGTTGSRITGLRAVGGLLYFGADGETGPQLYVSDGTAKGTTALTDVEHSSSGHFPTNPYPDHVAAAEAPAILSAEPGRVFFSIGDKVHGRQLWVTDGTKAGTKMTRAIGGPENDIPFGLNGPVPLGAVGGKLLFQADDDGETGRQLYASDGTAAGTAVVTQINPGTLGSDPRGFVAHGGRSYFTADGGVYVTDGKSAPRLLRQFGDPGAPAPFPWFGPVAELPGQLTPSGSGVYFVARTGAAGVALWRTDGTAAGTTLVKDADLAAGFPVWSGTPFGIDNPTDVNGTLYFTLDRPGSGQELWRTDGTAAGTKRVRRVNPDSSVYVPGAPPPTGTTPVRQLTAVGGKLYFVAGGEKGEELWASDGTEAGTKLVKDIRPGADGSAPDDLAVLNGKVYFTAYTGDTGRQLWASDGTAKGTTQIATINPQGFDPGADGTYVGMSRPRDVAVAGGKLFLLGRGTGWGGEQLWVSDGTAKGTRAVTDLPGASDFPGMPGDPRIDGLTAVGGNVYFSAADPTLGRQLFVSDGTAAGTKMVAAIGDGTQRDQQLWWIRPGANPVVLGTAGGKVYFAANDGKAGRELWATDGTAKGTKLFHEFNPGPADGMNPDLYSPADGAVVNGKLVVAATDGKTGLEPWAVTLPGGPTTPPTVPPADRPGLVAAMKVSATEGTAFTARLGVVTLPPASDYKVTVLWGDGRSSTGALARNTPTGKAYTVTGGYRYADPGTYTVRVTVTQNGRNVLVYHTTAVVADARWYAGRVAQRVAAGSPFNGVVATVSDTNPLGGKATDYAAMIDWGDGRKTTGTVRKVAPGKFEVTGVHTFAAAGRKTVTVTITAAAGGKVAKAESVFVIDPMKAKR